MTEIFRLTAMQIVDAMKRCSASEVASGLKQVRTVDKVTADAQRREQQLTAQVQTLESDLADAKARFGATSLPAASELYVRSRTCRAVRLQR